MMRMSGNTDATHTITIWYVCGTAVELHYGGTICL